MSHLRVKLESALQSKVLEELREKLAKSFGVSMVENLLTIRWGSNRQVSLLVVDVEHGEYVTSKWACDERRGRPCQYDADADPAHDSCVHCGEPEERK